MHWQETCGECRWTYELRGCYERANESSFTDIYADFRTSESCSVARISAYVTILLVEHCLSPFILYTARSYLTDAFHLPLCICFNSL